MDARSLGDVLASTVSGVEAFDAARPTAPFAARISGVSFSDVRLLAVSSMPARLEIAANDQTAFGFMTSGWMEMTIPNGITYRGVSGESGLVASSCPRLVSGDEAIATVILTIAPERLRRTARTMLGAEATKRHVADAGKLLAPGGGLLPLRHATVSWAGVLASLLAAIDAAGCDPAALEALAIEDQFARLLVALVLPEAVMSAGAKASHAAAAIAVKKACEFIEAHLAEPIGLTRLEEVTGLAARTLQLAFHTHEQCSPLEWLRRRRLECIRQQLLDSGDERPIQAIAAEHGFRQAGHFARQYARQFGERPSQTRLRRRRTSGSGSSRVVSSGGETTTRAPRLP